MAFRIAMLGDIVGTPGRLAVAQLIPAIRATHRTDLIVANAENAAGGSGLTPEQYQKLVAAGLDGITLGDHVYKKVQIANVLETADNIIRPANLPAGARGRRWMRLSIPPRAAQAPGGSASQSTQQQPDQRPAPTNVYFVTILTRLYASLPVDEPFGAVERVLAELPEKDPIVIVEVHGETTSEKQALGWHLDGRVAAVLGTHTHVATADARVLPRGTAYITDLGMCGPYESVIGRRIDRVIQHLTTSMPAPFDVAEGDPRISGVVVEIDPTSRQALSIQRIELAADPKAPPFFAAPSGRPAAPAGA